MCTRTPKWQPAGSPGLPENPPRMTQSGRFRHSGGRASLWAMMPPRHLRPPDAHGCWPQRCIQMTIAASVPALNRLHMHRRECQHPMTTFRPQPLGSGCCSYMRVVIAAAAVGPRPPPCPQASGTPSARSFTLLGICLFPLPKPCGKLTKRVPQTRRPNVFANCSCAIPLSAFLPRFTPR